MGVEVSTYIWHQSKQKGSKLLVMLALADYASNDTGECYPGIDTLAEKARMTTRYLRTILSELETAGEIKRIHGAGQKTDTGPTNRYMICGFVEWLKAVKEVKTEPQGVNNGSGHADKGVNNRSPLKEQGVNNSDTRGEQECTQGVNYDSPKPSLEPSLEPSKKKNRKRDLVFDAVALHVFDIQDSTSIAGNAGNIGAIATAVRKQYTKRFETLDDKVAAMTVKGFWETLSENDRKYTKYATTFEPKYIKYLQDKDAGIRQHAGLPTPNSAQPPPGVTEPDKPAPPAEIRIPTMQEWNEMEKARHARAAGENT